MRAGAALLALLFITNIGYSQAATSPEQEQLLNGLRVLIWPQPGSPKVILQLRIHSGAAFDQAGKAGQMALLSDLFFPDPATKEYFTEEMGGRLNVNVTYDSMTITMEGKASELENIIEVLRNAVLATQLTPELVTKMRDARIKLIRDTAVSPAIVADRAAAVRLFGDFPYGRPVAGSAEDLARIERADLMFARERFLNSNNATLAIGGGITKPQVMRMLRQLLGPWRKSEQIIPATFRQPKAPDARTLIVSGPSEAAEVRLALRGLARSDADTDAAAVFSKVVLYRWTALQPDLARKPVFARSEVYLLPGMILLGTAIDSQQVADTIAAATKALQSLLITPPTAAELERAKKQLAAEKVPPATALEANIDAYLDQDTYRLSALPDSSGFQNVSAADVQRVASRLLKNGIASIIVGEPLQLKAALQGHLQFEVLGEVATPATPPKPPGGSNPR